MNERPVLIKEETATASDELLGKVDVETSSPGEKVGTAPFYSGFVNLIKTILASGTFF